MTWTNDKPAEPGWYHYKGPEIKSGMVLVYKSLYGSNYLSVDAGGLKLLTGELGKLTGEFSRPSMEPALKLEDLKSIVAARCDQWNARLCSPHDKAVAKSEEEYRSYFRGRLQEAQAMLELLDGAQNGRDVDWARPGRPTGR